MFGLRPFDLELKKAYISNNEKGKEKPSTSQLVPCLTSPTFKAISSVAQPMEGYDGSSWWEWVVG